MEFLYAPWRKKYIQPGQRSKSEKTTEDECVFCKQIAANEDEKFFILYKGSSFVVMLNLYPYNPGHLLIVSRKHVPSLNDFSVQERSELIELANTSIEIVKKALSAEGVNVGINLGKVAGAGIPSHFHQHILPRWQSDTNFLPTLAETKQISIDLHELYQQLKPYYSDK